MNKQAVIDIVKNIFTSRGYSVGYSEICDLLAEKDKEHLLIKFDNDPNLNNVKYFSGRVKIYGKGILISESFDDNIRTLALDNGLILWDRSELEMQIGRSVLAGALERFEEKQHVKEDSINISSKEPIGSIEHKNDYERPIKVMLRCVPVNIGKQDALSIAEAKVGMPRSQTLELIPVWYYSYSFNIQKKYKSRTVDLSGNGEGYIHGMTGENFFYKYGEIRENIMMPTRNYNIRNPSIQKKEALIKSMNSIIREHTKEVRLNEMIGDTIVFENRIFVPDPSEIDLKIDLLHIPVWEVKGKREVIDINGHDGHIMAIRLYNDAELT